MVGILNPTIMVFKVINILKFESYLCDIFFSFAGGNEVPQQVLYADQMYRILK